MKKSDTEFMRFKRIMARMQAEKEKDKQKNKIFQRVNKQHRSNKKEYLKEIDGEDN